MIKAHRSKYY